MELKLASDEDKEQGWTFDYKVLEQLQIECERATGFSPGLEEVETVLIVLREKGLLAEAVQG